MYWSNTAPSHKFYGPVHLRLNKLDKISSLFTNMI